MKLNTRSRRNINLNLLISLIMAASATGCSSMYNSAQKDDRTGLSHLDYLKIVEGPEALNFAKLNNKLSDAKLKSDSRYQTAYNDIFKIVSAKDKLPFFYIMNGEIYNFWQDDVHINGILRKTSIESINTGKPQWTTVLDIDAISKAENKNWVYKGISCYEPAYELCMVSLSDGGKDAGVLREFNLKKGEFVTKGFFVPESKSHATWFDENTLLVGDGTNPTTLTPSGYPSEIRILKRGRPLENSDVLFKADKSSMSAYVTSFTVDGKRYTTVTDQISFYEAEFYFVNFETNKLIKIPIPRSANFEALYKGQILFTLRTPLDQFPAGSLLAMPYSELESYKVNITSVFQPTETRFFERLAISKNNLYIETLNDVKRQIFKMASANGQWTATDVKVAGENGNESLSTLDKDSDAVYFNYSDFVTPTSIIYINDKTNSKARVVLQSPSRFDGKKYKIEQFKATSKDGTKVPYFVVSNKKTKLNGQNPTLMYGYGGFEIPMTASYLGSTGKVWLEKGGVYVLANIRGGGEYGPNWHRAALRENRHKAYEDFFAIAEDLIAKKITSPQKLGIRGGSNGGLLTSVAFTQRPELFKAVISEVPLANMLEYHQLLAGASWMEEYGDPGDPLMREYLRSYSPLHNLKKNKNYPEVFYLTSTKDDRVHPGHARQMVARLQELGYPVLYNENTDGGHGRATNMKELAEFLALEFTYLYQKLMD